MAMLGLTREDFAADLEFEVFPDNWTVVQLFSDMSTQWRMGMSGPTGLDYNAIPTVFRLRGVPRSEWPEKLSCIQVMEDEALKTMHKRD